MTYESEIAKQVGYKFECKKDGFSQLQSGVTKVSLTINPDDLPIELLTDKMGQRYIAVLVPIGDDESPVQKPKSYAQQAVMMCKDEVFTDYIKKTQKEPWFIPGMERDDPDEKKAEAYIRWYCNASSRSELIEGTEAGRRFKDLQSKVGKYKVEMEALEGMQR